jgi:uncharacterized protein (DUF58 family)
MASTHSKTGGIKSLKSRFQRRFAKWVNRRIPPARSITLSQRRIFIFPSRVGFFFGLALIVMLLTGINYQNNMTFALTFLLATLFVVGVLHTYANLSGLVIRAGHAKPAFPGQQSEFEVLLERSKKRHHVSLHLKWPDSDEMVVSLVNDDSASVRLHAPVSERGWFSPGRLLVESTYPLGLLRCWTWLDLDLYALVYPRPLVSEAPAGLGVDRPDGASIAVQGNYDFSGFRSYRRGDSLKQVHWKGLARGQNLQTKQYTAYADRCVWLDWEMFPGLGIEQRLSHLCYWVLSFESAGEEYGLRLPGLEIATGLGEAHREHVLRALALHGITERKS